jgi:hypothetical protein
MPLRVFDVGPAGALIQVGIRVGKAFAAVGLGGAPRSYVGLIDIGASRTAISPQVVAELQPRLLRPRHVVRPGTSFIADTYELQLKLDHHLQPGTWYDVEAVEVAPASPGVDVLIGRDLLKHVTLLYDGPNGKLVLMY